MYQAGSPRSSLWGREGGSEWRGGGGAERGCAGRGYLWGYFAVSPFTDLACCKKKIETCGMALSSGSAEEENPPASLHTQEEPYGKKSSMGSENRQRRFRGNLSPP